jgi:large subunit ribosomal protein L21e|tara:strand:- start:1800 stop:2096 length:297 start_codon:yes stop_codon:yes gene_type:complete
MASNIGGLRRKSRYKFKKERRQKGKVSISRFMQTFSKGQGVHLSIEPSLHKSSYHSRFIGKTGKIKGIRGKCYEVTIEDKGKEKMIIVHPSHLKTTEA